MQFFVIFNYLKFTSSYPDRLPISSALCASVTSLLLGIRSNLLTPTSGVPHNRTPSYLSRSSHTGFFTILIYVLSFPPLFYFMVFFFSSDDNTLLRVLSESWPLNKAHLKYLPCPRNPFKFFHLYTIIFLITPCVHAKLLQSCWTLCEPMHCSLPGSSVHGILQAETLEWGALPSSRESS